MVYAYCNFIKQNSGGKTATTNQLNLYNYESWKIICKGWTILCPFYGSWYLYFLEILWLWTHVRVVLLHVARSVVLHEKYVERLEKHALNYSALSSRTINQLKLIRLWDTYSITTRTRKNCVVVNQYGYSTKDVLIALWYFKSRIQKKVSGYTTRTIQTSIVRN